MCKKIFVAMVACLMSFAVLAEPTVDILPTSIKFKKGLDDDVSMSYSQHVHIFIKNIGNVPFKKIGPYSIELAGQNYKGYIYGPNSEGGMLGGKIAPGKEGKIRLRIPLNTLKHCQKVKVDISSLPQFNYYQDPNRNDVRTLTAMEYGNRLACLRGPFRPIRPLQPVRRLTTR